MNECIETGTGQYAMQGGVESTRYEKNAERISMEKKYLGDSDPKPQYSTEKYHTE